MSQAYRIARAAGGLLGRVAVWFVAWAFVAVAFIPSTQPDAPGRPGPDDPEPHAMTVALTVPEGDPSKTLTITDASGRELATLTHWRNGEVLMVARHDGGCTAGMWLYGEGRATVELRGTTRKTRTEMDPDGKTNTYVNEVFRLDQQETGRRKSTTGDENPHPPPSKLEAMP